MSDIFYQKLKSRYRESKKPLEKTKRQWAGGEIKVKEENNKGGFQQRRIKKQRGIFVVQTADNINHNSMTVQARRTEEE